MFGPYRLEQLLGRGGMGEVFRAYDTEHRRHVAVKLLAEQLADDDEFQGRFRREAFSAARLRNPHIVPIHRYGTINGRLYIDMRLVEGGDLNQLIRANGPVEFERATSVIEQIASALEEAHGNGLVHRDVKPSNVLLDGQVTDFCYLADFGVTRLATVVRSHSLTRTGAILGSLAYMAPEQFEGDVTKQSDIYSLACVLFELTTGRKPYDGEGLPALMHAHMNVPPPRPSAYNPSAALFDDVIAAGMAKDLADRYANARDLAQAARSALRACQRGLTAPARRASADQPDLEGAHATTVVSPGPAPPPIQQHEPRPAVTVVRASSAHVPAQSATPVGSVRRRRWALPVAGAAAVAILLASITAIAGQFSPLEGRPAAAAAQTATATTASTDSATAGPVLTEAVYTGRSSDNRFTVAVGIKDGRAAGYICDGRVVDGWLEGAVTGDHITLHGRAADTTLAATADQHALLGTVGIAGTSQPFSAQITAGAAGLFQNKRVIQGITARIGWIVLPDGTQVGIQRQGDIRTPAPLLNPKTLQSMEDGQTLIAQPVAGDTPVLG